MPLSSGTLLYAAYAYQPKSDSDSCKVQAPIRQQIKQEEDIGAQGHRRNALTRSYRRSSQQHHQQQRQSRNSASAESSSESKSQSSEVETRQPTHHQQIRVNSQNQICFAEESLSVCPQGYYPVGGESRPG